MNDVKYILLTLDSEIEYPLIEASQSSKHGDGMILAKAVAIVRSKYLTLMKPLMVTYHER